MFIPVVLPILIAVIFLLSAVIYISRACSDIDIRDLRNSEQRAAVRGALSVFCSRTETYCI